MPAHILTCTSGGAARPDFPYQVRDTLCFITYIVLTLGKRFAAYETMGEMFRAEKEQLLALTLWRRLLSCMEKLLTALAESLGAEPMQMIQNLLNDEECARQTMVLAEALLKYYSDNEREVA